MSGRLAEERGGRVQLCTIGLLTNQLQTKGRAHENGNDDSQRPTAQRVAGRLAMGRRRARGAKHAALPQHFCGAPAATAVRLRAGCAGNRCASSNWNPWQHAALPGQAAKIGDNASNQRTWSKLTEQAQTDLETWAQSARRAAVVLCISGSLVGCCLIGHGQLGPDKSSTRLLRGCNDFAHEQVGPLNLYESRDAPRFPVVHSLRPAKFWEAKHLGNLGGPTKALDQFGVGFCAHV